LKAQGRNICEKKIQSGKYYPSFIALATQHTPSLLLHRDLKKSRKKKTKNKEGVQERKDTEWSGIERKKEGRGDVEKVLKSA